MQAPLQTNDNLELYQLKRRIQDIEERINFHIGANKNQASSKYPHPNLSAVSEGAYTVTNGTEDRTYDADSTSTNELADILYTLITDLKLLGIIG